MTDRSHGQRAIICEQLAQLIERHEALFKELRDIKRQRFVLMQRAARIKLQLAQRGLAALQRD